MYLERLLQINMATLAALGALLLGMGQRSEGPPLLVVAAAGLSIWLTDITGRFSIGRRTANVLMLAAAGFSIRNVFPLTSEVQAIGLAWFLILLQIILLFRKKDERIYWLLVMLSLLQVVVATLFSPGVWFGVLLAVYMLLGFSAMTLSMLYRQWKCCQPAIEGSGVRGQGSGGRRNGQGGRETREGGEFRRWPLLAGRPEFRGVPGGSSHTGVDRSLFRHLGRMALSTSVLTLVLFFALPRLQHAAWRGPVSNVPQPLVGFTDQVTLGELGPILESRDEVMRVRFYGNDNTEPVQLQSDLYLQGAVLTVYRDGKWIAGKATTGDVCSVPLRGGRDWPPGVTRQKITIGPMDRTELFFVAPYLALKDDNLCVNVDYARQRLLRDPGMCARQFEYVLGTTAIVDGRQRPLVPATAEDIWYRRSMPTEKLPNLIRLAKQWADESKLPESDPCGRARYLERQLASSGRFQYSLTGQSRNGSIDPIEDFVTEHPTGHCEYFATALTLMLRSQGIPARLVSGYKCDSGDWQPMGRYYQVRQLHAHTWVEAYLQWSQIPKNLVHAKDHWHWEATGGWLRLDPTPAGAVEDRQSWFTPVRNGLEWLDAVWSNYVVELDFQRQRDAIYKPIAEFVINRWQKVADPSRWRGIWESSAVVLYLRHLHREVQWLLGAAAVLVAAALAAGVGWLLARRARRFGWRGLGRRGSRARGRGVEIAFYRRFERLMARRGLVRASAQTQREFAAAAGDRLVAHTGDGRWAALPPVIADAFYRVRFGQMPLDNLQAQAVEQILGELAQIRV
jgi:protein-glutamine gamma-glutamyltransferase